MSHFFTLICRLITLRINGNSFLPVTKKSADNNYAADVLSCKGCAINPQGCGADEPCTPATVKKPEKSRWLSFNIFRSLQINLAPVAVERPVFAYTTQTCTTTQTNRMKQILRSAKGEGGTLCFAILLMSVFAVQKSNGQTAGPNFAGTGATGGGSGAGWTNPTRVTADDNSYTTVQGTGTAFSEALNSTNFGFSIPSTATINGITVTIGRFSNTAGISDNSVRLLKAGIASGSNLVSGTTWPTSEGAAIYGATNNLWGTTWTPADINNTNFGVALIVSNSSTFTTRTASVDYVQITVSYSVPVPTITSFSPASVCTGGGNPVVITGTNLTGATAVTFNNVAASSFTVNSSTQITATTPATVSTGTIKVTTPGGTATSTTSVTVNPVISGNTLTPTQSSVCSGSSPGQITGSTPTGGSGTYTYAWQSSITSGSSGFGATLSTAQNFTPGSQNQVTWYRRTVTSGGCTDISTAIQITVNPLPQNNINTFNGNTICNGGIGGVGQLTLSIATGTGPYTIVYNDGIADQTVNSYNSGDAISVATNPTVTTNYTLKSITDSKGCTATTGFGDPSATITVNLPPTISVGGNPQSQTICTTRPVTFTTAATGTTPLSYQWRYSADGVNGWTNIGTNSSTFVIPNVASSDVGYYDVVISNSCGSVTSANAQLSVSQTPVLSPVSGFSVVYCNSTALNPVTTNAISFGPSGTGISYHWTNDHPEIGLAASDVGDIASFNPLNSTNAAIVAHITVYAQNDNEPGACQSNTQSFTITVNPAPAVVSNVGTQTLCDGSSKTITFTGTSTLYTYTNISSTIVDIGLPNGTTTSSVTFTGVNSGNAPVTQTYQVVPQYTTGSVTCSGDPITFDIIINPRPTVDALPASQAVCSGASTVSIAISNPNNISGTTYSWTRNNVTGLSGLESGTGALISGAITNSTNGQLTTVYTITATTLDGCSRTTTASVIVNPVASIATINNVEVCTGSTTSAINFSGPVSGTTFEWQSDVDFGFGTGVVSGSNIPAFAAVNGTTDPIVIHIQVTPTANGCAGTPSSFTITVYPAIAEGGISGDQEICASLAPAQLAGSQASGGKGAGSYTYLWESSTTGASSGFTTVAGPSAALQNYTPGVLTQTTWYRRTVISDGCQTSPSTAVKVTVNPRPTAAITTSSANSCAGDNVSLSFNITATSAWTLTLDNGGGSTSGSGSGTFTMNVNPSSTTTYHIASFADSKCSALPAGITGSATLTVKPKPSVVLSTSNSTVCNGSSVTLTAANSGGVNDNSISSGIITLPAGSTSIPNNNAAGRSSTFNVPVHRSLSAASKIIVTISVNHGNVGDLTGTLTGPSGQTIVVFDGGNSNRNFITANTYTFNSTSATAFPPNGTGDIPAGTFVFNSTAGTTFPVSDIFGTWTMKIADQSNTDNSTGAFNSWSIQFASDGAYTTAFNGAGPFGTINYGDAGHTSANVSVTPTVSGDYTATTTDVNGCSGTSNIISLNVNSLTPYTVSGGGVYCDGQGTPDQSIKLSGSTNGVSYTLYKDGSPTAQVLPGADGPLDFGIQTSSGVYTVVGSQGVLPQVCTLTMSGNASVTVNTVPLINSPLADQATCGGSTAIFALDASGSGLTYQWYKGSSPLGNGATGNGSTITGATTATLTISNANVADAASDYNCVVSGCGTTLTSTNAQLIVTAIPVTPPALVSNSPQCASPGVTITSSGTPAANETWYWQTTNNGTSTANPATGVGGSATFVATASGTYYLRGKSDIAACWGNQVSIAVTVNALPADPNPSSITGNVNSCGVVTITRNGGTQNTWYWQGTDPDGTRTDLGTGTTYTQTVTVAQSYTFYLRARNTNGCWSAGSKSVVVNVPAGSTGISNNIITASKTNICYGDPVAFTGTDLGAGVTYQWQFLNVATWTNIPGETGQNYSSAPFTAQATVSYRRHATKGSCSIDSDPVAITITTASTGTGFTDQTVRTPTAILCGPGTVSLSSNGASSVNNWYAEDGTTLLGQTTGTTPISIQVTGENTVVYLEGLSTAPGCVTAAKTPIVITASNLQTQVSASVPAICLTGPSVIPASTLTVTNTNWGVPGTAAKTYAAAKFSTYKTIENATQFPGSANNTSGIALTNAPAGLLLNDSSEIELTLNINAQYAEDLDIFLVDPTGLRAMQVSTDKGPGNSAGHAYWGTVFNTNATTGITFNSTPLPFTGVYRPEGSLIQVPNLSGAATPGGGGSPSYDGVIPAKALVDETGGAPVNGTWTLKVYDDNAQGGAGMLISWSMKIKMKGNDTTTFTSDPATGVVINPLSFIGQSGSADITLPQSAGIYTITASTKDGAGCTTTANKILTVTEPAGITAGPADVTVCENNDAVFSVTTEGGTPHYQWQQSINGTDWTDIGTDVSSLTIPTVTAAMNGYKYHVIVNNTAPCEPVTSPDVTLTVHTEAVLDVLLPVDVTGINSGTPASFSVSASGDESFSYQWQVSHNGGAFTDISDNGTYSGSATFKLDIGSASANLNNNQYRCIVAGSCGGPVTSRAALLQLNLIAQTITFNPIEDKTYGDVFDITPYASASSALPLTFTIVNGPATIDANNMITVTGVGVVTVKASQPGNEEYLPAEDVTQTFNVLKAAGNSYSDRRQLYI
ncbi:MAG: proprotein convertase P-domain-containing protein [Bacteroidota bacterium]